MLSLLFLEKIRNYQWLKDKDNLGQLARSLIPAQHGDKFLNEINNLVKSTRLFISKSLNRITSNPTGRKRRLEVVAAGIGLKIKEFSGDKQPFDDF